MMGIDLKISCDKSRDDMAVASFPLFISNIFHKMKYNTSISANEELLRFFRRAVDFLVFFTLSCYHIREKKKKIEKRAKTAKWSSSNAEHISFRHDVFLFMVIL